jgi:hypothetical protein
LAKRRPLTKQEQDKLMRELAMMRMLCDTTYILDPNDRTCPKLRELRNVVEESCEDPDTKLVVFSEWVRMLELVRDMLKERGVGYAWHTGSVPQLRRRAEIRLFKTSPDCRVFLSSDSGGVGLNLQAGSVVVNCDLPWNPARLEQRIARVWRKHQTRAVTVVNLVSEGTIEHRMLATLADKQGLADGVLDGAGNLREVRLRRGAQAFMKRLEQVMTAPPPRKAAARPAPARPPVDRAAALAERAAEALGGRLIACEERYPEDGPHSVVVLVVDRDAESVRPGVEELHAELFGPDKTDPLSPVQVEVIDRATSEALERLATAGLVTNTLRAARQLYPAPEVGSAPLSEEACKRLEEARDQAARKLKMARLLVSGDLQQESREALSDALLLLGNALALRHRLPPPRDLDESLAPPLLVHWGDLASDLQSFLQNPDAPLFPLFDRLEDVARKGD